MNKRGELDLEAERNELANTLALISWDPHDYKTIAHLLLDCGYRKVTKGGAGDD